MNSMAVFSFSEGGSAFFRLELLAGSLSGTSRSSDRRRSPGACPGQLRLQRRSRLKRIPIHQSIFYVALLLASPSLWQAAFASVFRPLPLLRRSEFEGQLVDLAGETERQRVAVVDDVRVSTPMSKVSSIDMSMGIVWGITCRDAPCRQPIARRYHLCGTRAVVFEVEHDGVLARGLAAALGAAGAQRYALEV